MQETKREGSIPGSRRSPGGGHGNPLWYSSLENPMDRETWQTTFHGVTNSQTHWNNLARTYSINRAAIWNIIGFTFILCMKINSKSVKNFKVNYEIIKIVHEDTWELFYYLEMEKSLQLLYKMKKPEEKKTSFHVFKNSVCKNGQSRVKRRMTLGKYL